jgi:hypothetical protein
LVKDGGDRRGWLGVTEVAEGEVGAEHIEEDRSIHGEEAVDDDLWWQ